MLANSGAGAHDADAARAAIGEVFDASGIEWRWHAPGALGGAGLEAALREALHHRPDVLVAAGGDGTVNSAANAIAKLPAADAPALGIVPLGTFNFVARRYGVPTGDAAAAAALVAGGARRRIGAGEVNGHLFLNNCSFGLYTSLIDARERHKRRFGRHRIVALGSALATLLKPHGRLALLLRTPGRTLRLRASLVFVGANPLQLDDLGPEFAAAVADGSLGFVALRSFRPWRLLRLAWGAVSDSTGEMEEVESLLLREGEITLRRRRLRCVVDGELMQLATPLHLRWRDDALALCAPADEEPER